MVLTNPLRKSVTVRVPATSANLGSGFDVLGLAVNLFNDVTLSSVHPDGSDVTSFSITMEGEGADWLPRDATNMCAVAVRLAFVEAGICTPAVVGVDDTSPVWDGPPIHLHLVNRIPIGAGLGSSSAAVVGGLLAGLTLARHAVAVTGAERLLNLACTVEGHADNVSACIYGGLQVGVHTGTRWFTTQVNVPPGLQCIFFIPDKRQSTEGARAILTPLVPREDAVFNLGRIALFVNAFASGSLDDLALATEDALHQPARCAIMPALAPCIKAALAAGAKGAFLSGAGSAIMAITAGRKGDIHSQVAAERRDVDVARAMALAARHIGHPGVIVFSQPTSQGAHVIALDGDASAIAAGKGLRLELDPVGCSLQALGVDSPRSSGAALGAPSSSSSSSSSLSASFTTIPSSIGEIAAAIAGGLAPATAAADALWLAWIATTKGGAHTSVRYESTRAAIDTPSISFAEAVFAGLAPDGGLYVPTSFPALPPVAMMRTWASLPYASVAARVLSLFIRCDELPFPILAALCADAYKPSSWGAAGAVVAPLVPLRDSRIAISEHFHGPTCAFKDLALQLLGRIFGELMRRGAKGAPRSLTILGATSGDTGSAAMAGLKGIPGVRTIVLHPVGGVARVQALQMTSVLDPNVHAVAVGPAPGAARATFDDLQSAVKSAFIDAPFATRHNLSAINSINIARVLAQTSYHVYSWLQWDAARGGASASDADTARLVIAVPSGNFGNALSAHYARTMGTPLDRVHVATNANDVLHRVLSTGSYVAPTIVAPTLAPSMDINVASNFERYLHAAALETGDSGSSSHRSMAAAATRAWHAELASTRKIQTLPPAVSALFTRDFTSSASNDVEIDATIRRVIAQHGYAACPHTATALHAAVTHPALIAAEKCGALVICATAHPAKFAAATPALAEAGLYFAETGIAPESALCLKAKATADAAFGIDGPLPKLPQCLRGLASKPSRVVSLSPGEGQTLLETVKAFVELLPLPAPAAVGSGGGAL
jgi:threonine synthase/homoserine kinase